MRFLKIAVFLVLPFTFFAQQNYNSGFRLKSAAKEDFSFKGNSIVPMEKKNNLSFLDSLSEKKTTSTVRKSKKSPGLAFIYGFLIPGMGHVYSGNFNTGKYFMISEAAVWLTYTLFSVYGNWLLDDAYSYASTHAGVTVGDKAKDDKFFIDIANYSNVDEYNNEKLRFGEYDKLYYPEQGYGFYWNSDEERRLYRGDKIGGDRMLNDRLFVVGAVFINHLISAISAVFAANSYNSELKESGSGGFRMTAGVQKHFNVIDGIKLNISKNF
ncbi:MAG: hypothetical protein ABI543_12000 [Ignavibacteria bacterium]